MEEVPNQMKRDLFLISGFDSFYSVSQIKLGFKCETDFRPGVGNLIQKDFASDQKSFFLVHHNKRK